MITTTALLIPQLAHAQESDNTANATAPTRPAILPNRWEEDWSVLADPRVPREPLDSLKYMSLSPDDSKTYLSLGADFRERFEANDAANFGVSRNQHGVARRSSYRWPSPGVRTVRERFAPWKTTLIPFPVD